MKNKFKNHVNENLPFLKKGKLLLAISGGIDSVVLAHLLKDLHLNFSFAHCNFKLRYDDSDKDEVFVKHLAQKLNVPCHTISFDTKSYAEKHKLSTQMAARELRYNWFDELVGKNKYQYILTAHHCNDNLETVLINLTRGATLQKLTGIPEVNNNIVRPLLPFTRHEIEQHAIDYKISWREDESNQSTKYFRNKIRHEVIPVLEELNKNVLQTFNEHLQFLKAEQNVLQHHIQKTLSTLIIKEGKTIKIDVKKFQELAEPKVYLLYLLAQYGFSDWEAISDLLQAQSGKKVMSKTHRLIKDRDFLLLEKNTVLLANYKQEIPKNCTHIEKPIALKFEEVSVVNESLKESIFVDADKLKYPLHLRKKAMGDVFYPFGMKGKKKISKYFKDEKLSLIQKENVWLLCNADDTVIWIVNKRADNRFKVTTATKKIIKITSPKNQ